MNLGGTAVSIAVGKVHACAFMVQGFSPVQGRRIGSGAAQRGARAQGRALKRAGVGGTGQAGCGCCVGMGLGGGVQGERDARVLERCAEVDYEAHGCAVLGRVCVNACCVDPTAPRDEMACVLWVLVRMSDRGSISQSSSQRPSAAEENRRREEGARTS